MSNRRIWDTNHVPEAEAFELYRDGICSAFMPLRPERPCDRNAPFHSRHVSQDIDGAALNLVSASPHPVFKDKAEIAASEFECYYLNLQLSGRCGIAQSDKKIQLRSGQLAVFDSARAFELDHGQSENLRVLSLMIPKTSFSDRFGGAPKVLSDHPVYGPALKQAVAAFAPASDKGDLAELKKLKSVVIGLAELAVSSEQSCDLYGNRRTAQYYRICAMIRRNCRDDSVRVENIASMVGLSVGAVRNIFTVHGDTFGRRLLDERLEVAKEILGNPLKAHLSVAEVAYQCGFTDAAHFGKTFKAKLGISPGAWRNSL